MATYRLVGNSKPPHSELLQGLSIKLTASFRMLAAEASTGPLTSDQKKRHPTTMLIEPQDKHVEKGKQTKNDDEQNILVKIEALVDNGQVGLAAQM